MNRKERFRDAMDTIDRIERETAQLREATRRAESIKHGIDPDNFFQSGGNWELNQAIFEIQNQSVRHLDAQRKHQRELFYSQISFDDFIENDSQAIDVILDLLEIAHTSLAGRGIKLFCYPHFHLLILSAVQIQRLQQLTLYHCQQGADETLLGWLAQIMEKHCNDEIRPKLHALAQETADFQVRERAEFVLRVMDMLVARRGKEI